MTAPILKLRAVKAKDLEGFPLISVGDGWYLETVGMSASSVGDALAALGDDDAVIHLLAKAPQLAADVTRLTAERDRLRRDLDEVIAQAARDRDAGYCGTGRQSYDAVTAERDEALRGEEAATAIRAAIISAGAHEGEAYVDAVKRITDERDEAQKMVAELRRLLSRAHQAVVHEAVTDDDAEKLSGEIDAALSSTSDVAGRWCPVAERDAAIARAEKAESLISKRTYDAVMEMHRKSQAQAAEAERQRDDLGIQYEALKTRAKAMQEVVDAARTTMNMWAQMTPHLNDYMVNLSAALARLNALPGDALARPTLNGVPLIVDENAPDGLNVVRTVGTALDRAHEANGVVVRKDGVE